MFRSILSVGSWTLLSRITGFARDIVMAAVLGAGGLMDIFTVAFRLPNHFRAIFGEGAFNSAFVPAFSRIRTQEGEARASLFHGRILSLLFASQIILLVVAWLFMPFVVKMLAPGFAGDASKMTLAVEITRITFPYLLLITLVTLWSGVLNSSGHYAAAAAAPVLLNLALLVFVQMAFLFPTPAHAAGWGVFAAGLLEAALLAIAAWRAGLLVPFKKITLDDDIRKFFSAFLPAVIGSAGVQIAMFADTILSTLLPVGSASALYYADRIYQLPLGVIAIAAGTVLLPTMSKLVSANDHAAAYDAQNRTIGLTLLLAAPFWVATLIIPELIIRAVFQRGAFDADAAAVSGQILSAYGVGLIAAVTIRSVVASFHSRGDTRSPMYIALGAVAFNVILKLVLTGPLGVMGLALATAVGASVNLALLVWLADYRGWIEPDKRLAKIVGVTAFAALALAIALLFADGPIASLFINHRFSNELRLVMLGLIGATLYGGAAYLGCRLFHINLRGRA
jgi:putative peptidoglycan lipid II flippase